MHEVLCFAGQKVSRKMDGKGLRFADVLARSSIVFCNSVFADRIVMAASRLLGAAVEWLHQGCHSDLSADFLNFGAGDFPLKIQ